MDYLLGRKVKWGWRVEGTDVRLVGWLVCITPKVGEVYTCWMVLNSGMSLFWGGLGYLLGTIASRVIESQLDSA